MNIANKDATQVIMEISVTSTVLIALVTIVIQALDIVMMAVNQGTTVITVIKSAP